MTHKQLASVKTFFMLLIAMFGLAACNTAQNPLPLADGKPTLLFFYTEN